MDGYRFFGWAWLALAFLALVFVSFESCATLGLGGIVLFCTGEIIEEIRKGRS